MPAGRRLGQRGERGAGTSALPPGSSRTANALAASRAAVSRHEAGDHPVDRAELRRIGAGVHQQRQPAVPRSGAGPGLPPPVLQLQVGRVAVMAVRDQRGARGQVGGDRGQLIPDR